MRRAKARAAARGESLKALLARAVASEVGTSHHDAASAATRVQLPLFGDSKGPRVDISNSDIAQLFAEEDEESARRFNKRRTR